MPQAAPPGRRVLIGLAAVVSVLATVTTCFAYLDQNANRLDDRIESVHADGWNAAFVNHDPAQKMRIGVENPLGIVYAIYVRYDHKPNSVDETLLAGTGVAMVWPFRYIPYIESRATWAQVQLALALPGVTRVEAVPVDYATNHYGSRVVRARDSRGLSAAENYALFPSARQELGLDGDGVVIGVLDTGVNDDVDTVNPGYPGHESLKGKFLGGGEFWCGQAPCVTATNASTNPVDHGAAASHYHATHCAGTAMGTGGLGGFFAGVAPGARLVDCKVLSDAGASVGGSPRGVEWCIANRHTLWAGLAPGSKWQGIDVLSMSLGSTECAGGSGTSTGAGSEVIDVAVDSGLVVVIATGNDNSTECIASPASADKSIAVGASAHYRTLDRADDKVTSFSNEGPRDDDADADHFDEYKPSIVAPGAGILSADGDFLSDGTGYQQLSGTSMATPHAAGVAALVLQANPSLTPLQLRTILQNTADHDTPTEKATGDRGQDPYGIDPNYDPGAGWGLVDVFAAAKEALNSTSGVQVVQERGIARPLDGAIDFRWVTQREYPFLGFNVYRAPDAGGTPGAFAKLNALPIAGTGDPVIQGDDNRQRYLYADTDPALTVGQRYWYRVEWIDLLAAGHLEPPLAVDYGTLARVATAFYGIAHNAVDNDLLVRLGSDLDYDPGSLGQATFEVLGPGESGQDSARVFLSPTVPANTGTSTVGTIEHFWSVGFRQGDGAEPYLPPSVARPWFLRVVDGGYVNRTGRVTGYSLFVNDSPGSAGGTTFVSNHMPLPQPTLEGGVLPVTLWIPEQSPTGVAAATFRGDADAAGVRLRVVLGEPAPGVSATVWRAASEDFEARESLTPDPIAFDGRTFEYLDGAVEPGVTYHYWVQVHQGDGTSFMNGPVAVTAGMAGAGITFAAAPAPNPVVSSTAFEYAIGSDVAAAGAVEVSLRLHDLQGRVVRTLRSGREAAGRYRAEWNATDDQGRRVATGMYYLRFKAGPITQTQRVAVTR